MKRITSIILLLALLISMVACGTADIDETAPPDAETTQQTEPSIVEDEEPTEESTEPKKANGIYSNTLVLGNLVFEIPENHIASSIDENTYYLSTASGDCQIGLFAADVSALDEARVQVYLPMQQDSFRDEGNKELDAKTLDSITAGFDIKVNYYTVLTEDFKIIVNIDTTFTDSWYAYTILFTCDASSESLSDHIEDFVEFTAYAEYVGGNRRFEFIQ